MIQNFMYNPFQLTINMGDTVTWTNLDREKHTATADDNSFDTYDIPYGASKSQTFTKPGTYYYHCSIHPFMHGQIIVLGAPLLAPPVVTVTTPPVSIYTPPAPLYVPRLITPAPVVTTAPLLPAITAVPAPYFVGSAMFTMPFMAPKLNAVTIDNFMFMPPIMTINVGETVTWTNKAAVGHTATSDDNGMAFDTGLIAPGNSYVQEFLIPGTYTYHCKPHPYMRGTIIVR
jgi:plastocyanin